MLLIWDLDGTLVDSRADIVTAANAALADLGHAALPAARVASFVGDGIGALIERLLPTGGVTEREHGRAAFERHYAACCCQATVAYAGIHAALQNLSAAGWRHAVATNKALAYVGPILNHCGLTSHVTTIRGGDRRRKPDPWQLQDIARELREDVSQAWMIGDHHTDIEAARAAGCKIMFCTWGMGRSNGMSVNALAMAPDEIAGRIAGFPSI